MYNSESKLFRLSERASEITLIYARSTAISIYGMNLIVNNEQQTASYCSSV
jgi:hypothetical protein